MRQQPTFSTDRLILAPRTLGDTDECLRMDADPEVVRFIDGPWHDPVAHRAFVEERISTDFGPGLGYWTIRERQDPSSFLGWVLLIPLDAKGPEIEIGWRLPKRAWGRGIAAEAAAPILAFGLNDLDIREVVADIDVGNLASMRVAEKLGLKRGDGVMHAGRQSVRYSARRAD